MSNVLEFGKRQQAIPEAPETTFAPEVEDALHQARELFMGEFLAAYDRFKAATAMIHAATIPDKDEALDQSTGEVMAILAASLGLAIEDIAVDNEDALEYLEAIGEIAAEMLEDFDGEEEDEIGD